VNRIFAFLISILAACLLPAQVGPFPGTSVPLTSISQQSVGVPAGNNPTLLSVTIDAPASGQETIDVLVGDPNVVISLIRPDTSEITAANASANGFTFTTYTADGTGGSMDLLSPFLTGGTHTVIQFPAPTQTGVYNIKANATTATADTAMIIWYYPSSSVSPGAATDATTYRQGDFIILSGLLFDGTTPVQNATVSAIAGTLLPVSGTVGNYQLVGTTQVDSTFSQYTYTLQFTNSGSAANNVGATVSSSDPNMSIINDGVAFGSVASGGTVTSANTLSFLYPTASTYSLASLQWNVQVPGSPINVTLADSGTYDNASEN
jgi:hypothetical protein